jgi:hypothetical protein
VHRWYGTVEFFGKLLRWLVPVIGDELVTRVADDWRRYRFCRREPPCSIKKQLPNVPFDVRASDTFTL